MEPTLPSFGATQVALGADAKLTLEFSHSLGISPRKRRGASPARHGRGFGVSRSLFLAHSTHGTGTFAIRLLVLLILCLIPSALFPLWHFPDVASTVLLFAARHSWGGSYGKSEALAMFGRIRDTRGTAPTVVLVKPPTRTKDPELFFLTAKVKDKARDEESVAPAHAPCSHICSNGLSLSVTLRRMPSHCGNVGRTEAAKSPTRWESHGPIHVEEHVLS